MASKTDSKTDSTVEGVIPAAATRDPLKAAPLRPDDIVEIVGDNDRTGTVTRQAFEQVWSEKGFKLAKES